MARRKVYGNCAFCGNYAQMHGEHLWDNWMRHYIERTQGKFQSRVTLLDHPRSTETIQSHTGDPAHQKAYCVCQTCNNGWMSGLTKKAMPILKALINGDTCRIMESDQTHISNWMAIKTIVSERHVPGQTGISDIDVKYLYDTQSCPKEWAIYIANIPRVPVVNYSHAGIIQDLVDLNLSEDRTRDGFNTQSTSYMVGKLFIHVITSFDPLVAKLWKFPPEVAGYLKPIWPLSGYSITWPSPELSIFHAEVVASSLTVYAMHRAEVDLGINIGVPEEVSSRPLRGDGPSTAKLRRLYT